MVTRIPADIGMALEEVETPALLVDLDAPARVVRGSNQAYAMLVAQPDVDLGWFQTIDRQAMFALHEQEELRLLETRTFQFRCGCSRDRLISVLIGAFGDRPLA